ncbi:MAG TPA: HAMP domain-containing sensor histidine kinase, partial [Armatimonadota bacterium]
MLKNQASGIIVLAFLLFILWQAIDNSFLVNVPMESRHLLFIIVASVFALIVSYYGTSEINRQYRRLRKLEESKDSLTDMIVHDLRTPLTSMIGSLATMQQGGLGELNPAMSEMVDISRQGAEHLLEMVNDILDISRMESGNMILDIHPLKVNAVIESAVRNIRQLAFEKNIDLRVEELPEEMEVNGDEEKLRRVLINLLGNAVKFTPSGGAISVGAKEDHKSVVFTVADTGTGIPEEFRDRIFDKYGQVDTRQSRRTKSSGLGLTFCKLAVDAHHGR